MALNGETANGPFSETPSRVAVGQWVDPEVVTDHEPKAGRYSGIQRKDDRRIGRGPSYRMIGGKRPVKMLTIKRSPKVISWNQGKSPTDDLGTEGGGQN
jgi:hypothetical protein